MAWLYRVVRNKAISASRTARRRKHHETEATSCRPAWFEPSAVDRIDAGSAAVALESLPIEQREVVIGGFGADVVSRDRPTGGRFRQCGPPAIRSGLNGLAPEIKGAMSEKQIDNELAEIEASLGSLTPLPSSIHRDQLMFLAGRASASRALLRHCRLAGEGFRQSVGCRKPPHARRTSRGRFACQCVVAHRPSGRHIAAIAVGKRQLRRLLLEKGIDAMPQSPCRCGSGASACAPRRDLP